MVVDEKKDKVPDKPNRPCGRCGSEDWWLRENSIWGEPEWLCGGCHPNPGKEEEL